MRELTDKQKEMLKDLREVERQGFNGIAIRKSDKRHYLRLESQGLVYFLSGFGRGDTYSIRLTDKGRSN